jgi:hypothetical protein
MALLTAAELKKRPGLTAVDDDEATAVLDDVSATVRGVVTPLLDEVNWPETPAGVVPVVVAMARRALTNPNGYIGAMAGSMSWQASASDTFATDSEKRAIRRAVGLTSAGVAQMEGWLPTSYSEYATGTVATPDDTLTDLGL